MNATITHRVTCHNCGKQRIDRHFCLECLTDRYNGNHFMMFVSDAVTQMQQLWMDQELRRVGDVHQYAGYSIGIIELDVDRYGSVRFAIYFDEGSPLLNLDGILPEIRDVRRYRVTIADLQRIYPPFPI